MVLNIGDTLVIRQAVQAVACLDKIPACGRIRSCAVAMDMQQQHPIKYFLHQLQKWYPRKLLH